MAHQYDRDYKEVNWCRYDYEKADGVLVGLYNYGLAYTDVGKYVAFVRADARRQMSYLGTNRRPMTSYGTDIREYRYEYTDGYFKLKCWYAGIERSMRGDLHERPEWLVGIVDVARVSGHLKHPVSPPPQEILWFHTDSDNQLITFIDINP